MVHSPSSNALMSLEMKQEKLLLSNMSTEEKMIRASQSQSSSDSTDSHGGVHDLKTHLNFNDIVTWK